MKNEILEKLEALEAQLLRQETYRTEVLNLKQACLYLDFSTSHLYKLTSEGLIPFYKPNGKKLYFKRTELDEWMLSNRHASQREVEERVEEYKLEAC